MYRKLMRAKKIINERFNRGLYGHKAAKGDNEVYRHARSYMSNPTWNFNKKVIGLVKRIMDTQLVFDYKYGFDEIDKKKKLTPATKKKAREKITSIRGEIDELKKKRDLLKGSKRKLLTKKILDKANELYDL